MDMIKGNKIKSAEIETQRIIAFELGYIKREEQETRVLNIELLSKQIRSLISKLTPNPQSLSPNK
jgi:hypothetical protein